MKTEISIFCEACLHALEPLPGALQNVVDDLELGADKALIEKPRATLHELRTRVRSLVGKLENQHAYLLIFGPLKSGKSTLMNAISGAYVSEVTSLPGYPCLVFVQHAAEPRFSVTRYDGSESVFPDGAVLQRVIAESHVALAEQIRATEKRGEEFDPRTHFTEALRRVDIMLPVPSLAESSTVLVDTPGLYSRMNFGYDVLTREFRDTAACAVFVVKTDNLFLEQVFAEFNQLLDLFSRIFLVINVDSNKRDLRADGSLTPSAESAHPEAIIEAFKTLSMAGPLRQAYEEKRVRIHAVDLLNAASAFLADTQNGASAADPARARQKEAFDAFLRDLTDYLNSSDYTVEFVRDSLRQGNNLCEEVRELFAGEDLRKLRQRQVELEDGVRQCDERITAVDRLLKFDWDAAFAKSRATNVSRGAEASTAKAAEVAKEMRAALDRWFGGDESVKALEDVHWNPVLATAARTLGEGTRGRLVELVGTQFGGTEPDTTAIADLRTAGMALGKISQAVQPALHGKDSPEAYHLTLRLEQMPVRKTLGDWLLFRSAATVRRRLFGEDLQQTLPPEVKAKRLPDDRRAALAALTDQAVQERFPAWPEKHAAKLLAAYAEKFRESVLRDLRDLRERFTRERAALQAPFDAHARLLSSLQMLNEQAAKVLDDLNLVALQELGLADADAADESADAGV